MNGLLNNKVVVVTGGAGLLGESFCKAIINNGGTVIIGDIDLERGKIVCNTIKKEINNSNIEALPLDITSTQSIKSGIDLIFHNFGKIDALVNNAYPRNKNFGRIFEDIEFDDFCQNISLNIGGYFLCSQQFANFFKLQGYGNIINIASIYGLIAPRFEIYENTSMTMPVEYAAIKSAVIHLTKYMAKYFKGKNIRVNVISLGGILDKQAELFVNKYNYYTLNKGMLDSSDINGTLIYLLSDLSQFVNGQNIIVDDGFSL